MRNNLKKKPSNLDIWLSRIAEVSIISGVVFYILWMLWGSVLYIKDTNIFGFFGSIIGGIIGGLLTLSGVNKTIKMERKDKFIDEFAIKLKYFKQLLIEVEIFDKQGLFNVIENDHMKRMIINEFDIAKEINGKFEKIKDIAVNIDVHTYYLVENYEEFIVDEIIYYYDEARQYDLEMINNRMEPNEGAMELNIAMMDLFEQLSKRKNDIILDIYTHREYLENKYYEYNPLAERPKILWSRKLIDDFNNRESDEGWEHHLDD